MQFYLFQARQLTCATWVILLNSLFSAHFGALLPAAQLEHVLCTCTDLHKVLPRSSSDRCWGATLGRSRPARSLPLQLSHLCHSCHDWLSPWNSAGRNPALLMSHLQAPGDLGVCRGAAGAAGLLGVAQFVQKAEKMLCALLSLAAIKLLLKYLFPWRPESGKLNTYTVKGSINYMSPLGRKRTKPQNMNSLPQLCTSHKPSIFHASFK